MGLTGRTVVIYHEEGFGDTIQFLRYADLLRDAGAPSSPGCRSNWFGWCAAKPRSPNA